MAKHEHWTDGLYVVIFGYETGKTLKERVADIASIDRNVKTLKGKGLKIIERYTSVGSTENVALVTCESRGLAHGIAELASYYGSEEYLILFPLSRDDQRGPYTSRRGKHVNTRTGKEVAGRIFLLEKPGGSRAGLFYDPNNAAYFRWTADQQEAA